MILHFQTINKTKAVSETVSLCRVQPRASCTWMTVTPSVTVTEKPSACAGSACSRAVSPAGESLYTNVFIYLHMSSSFVFVDFVLLLWGKKS